MSERAGPDDAFTAEHAARVLAAACASCGLDPTGARLLRLGEHAVFRLRAPVVARVARAGADPVRQRRTVAAARWLEGLGYPAVRTLPGLDPPVPADGHSVTFWRPVAAEPREATPRQLAELLRLLHSRQAPAALGLPRLAPFAETWQRLPVARGLSDDDRTFLRARADELGKRYDALDFALPAGLIHDDAHTGNALVDERGDAVLIDLDGLARGPREWDLVQTAMHYERFGWHTAAEYEAFARGYGFDVLEWPGYRVLADMREVMMTVWLAQQAGHDARAAAEVARRVGTLRTGADRHGWRPF